MLRRSRRKLAIVPKDRSSVGTPEETDWTSDGDTLTPNPSDLSSSKVREKRNFLRRMKRTEKERTGSWRRATSIRLSKRKSIRKLQKEQKDRFRELVVMGQSSLETASGISGTVEEISTSVHYFWGSNFWTRIYMLVIMAILFRQPQILHGITLFVLAKVLERGVAWGLFLADSKEVRTSKQHVTWILKFALGELEKTVEGDTVRSWLASVSFNFWQGRGKSYVNRLVRNNVAGVNMGILKEAREKLERQVAERLKGQ